MQTFFTDKVCEDALVRLLNEASDAFRFGISGQLGASSFSVAIQYYAADIIVLRNRDTLIAYPGFWDVDFHSTEFQKMFHYSPENARNLTEHVEMLRQQRAP